MADEHDPDCVFCRIASGELPATVIAEDELTIALMDTQPAKRGHGPVVPRGPPRATTTNREGRMPWGGGPAGARRAVA